MGAPEIIRELVERFRQQIEEYKRGPYKEAQVRKDFIDPFFKALGWDMENKAGWAETYRDVIHEDSIRVEGKAKAPDYTFRIGSERKFFVEAKKPSVNISEDVAPAYQLRRYAWSAKLPLSILTDFEEFAVYDCTKRPEPKDKPSAHRVALIRYDEYVERWEEIRSLFSKEAILTGAFDKFAQDARAGRGTAEVDAAFLADLEEWRTRLAVNIALRNPQIDERELNFLVQKTIDRIVFLRICEDRGSEEYGTLQGLAEGNEVYRRLCHRFQLADQKYNSGLFHFTNEKNRPGEPDALSLEIRIEDAIVKGIVQGLYYPKSPYEFSILPVEILGHVYEQFLGSVIRLTKGHQARVEVKPEVRKAGGVFYTPDYIVKYIVRNTVGKLLEGKTPKEAERLKIVDPACGSGSFLLGAYQHLLDWHLEYYREHDLDKWMKGSNPRVIPTSKGDHRLSTAEKKRILLNNIYGVDIDVQAVEVTKLSLLLKVMERETEETLATQHKLFQERALPDLGFNIKCGNSLIGTDFYAAHPDLDEEEYRRVNAFDWDREFPEVFKAGGFDAVIGNPPYVRQELLTPFKPYFQTHYETYHGVADLYVYFIEKGLGLLREGGEFGIIVANKWLRANYGAPLRTWLKERNLRGIIDFGDLPIFQGATTYPCILRIATGPPSGSFQANEVDREQFENQNWHDPRRHHAVNQNALNSTGWALVKSDVQDILLKMKGMGTPLGDYVDGKIYYGIKTGLNKAFVIDDETRKRLIREDRKSRELIKPFLAGRDVKRYQPPKSDKFLICIPNGWTSEHAKGVRSKWRWLTENYPAIAGWLEPFKQAGEKRCDKGEFWWELRSCDYYEEFEKPKIFFPDISKRGNFTLDLNGEYYSANTTYLLPTDDRFLVGLLNSQLLTFYYTRKFSVYRGGYLRFFAQYLVQLPIPGNPDRSHHDHIVKLVESLLEMNARIGEIRTPAERERLQRRIDAADREIDSIVYELYDLTPEEIAVVEGAAG